MSSPVNLPELGESVTEGTVLKWLKQVGDEVAVDEPLLEISTDKVDTEIPSPVAGTLQEINVEEDETVEVGAQLCVIGEGAANSGDSGGSEGGESGESENSADPEDAGSGDSAGSDESDEPQAEALDDQAQPDAPQEAAEAQAEETDESPAQDRSGSEEAPAKPSGGAGSGSSVTLPELGESVTEGTVLKWLKQVGDEVAVDEPLLEISTDKVDTEIPSPVAGTLLAIKVQEDETVEVGAVLAVIGDADAQATQKSEPEAAEATEKTKPEPAQAAEENGPEAAKEPEKQPEPEPAKEPEKKSEPAASEPSVSRDAQPQSPTSPGGDKDAGQYVTPLVRKMAAEHGVDLGSLQGSGVGGRIRKQDVLDAAEKAKAAAPAAAESAPESAAPAASAAPASGTPSPLRGKTEPLSRLRKVIASRMVKSLQSSAQLTQVVEVDVTNVARLRESAKADFLAREGVKLSYLPFFAKAAVDALKVHPKLNANLNEEKGEVTYFDRENIAFAVDTDKGLLTPVVKDAGDLSIAGLAKKIADVAERTRTNKIGPDDLSGGTFTITNLGSVGALWDTPILNQPQVAILGPGVVVKRPVVIDDPNLGETIAVRHMVYLALTYDHRLVDGADAGRFLQDVKARLEAGQFDV